MIQFIEREFTTITRKAIERYAKGYNTSDSEVQLRFRLDYEGELTYTMTKGYQKVESVTFLEVLGVRIDFKGYSLIVPAFIKKTLERFVGELGCEIVDAMIFVGKKGESDISIWLYNQGSPVKSIQLPDLFTEMPDLKT